MERCENRKTQDQKYFKYANVTNEFTICDFLFNNNTFLTEITTSYSDRQYTQVTGPEYETCLRSAAGGHFVPAEGAPRVPVETID